MNHFLSIGGNDPSYIQHLLRQSRYLHTNPSIKTLEGKNILFCFEKPSLRTKVGTEVAINALGGDVIHISPEAFLGGKVVHPSEFESDVPEEREALKDTVKNVSEWCDAIFARVYRHQTLTTLASFSGIPIINALCDKHHPMQALADLYTLQEKFGEGHQLTVSFVGDANNVAFSLIEILLMSGHEIRFAGPREYYWDKQQLHHFIQLAKRHRGTFTHSTDPLKAVSGADAVYTDAFVSMGEEKIYDEKLAAFRKYQVNGELFEKAPSHAGFMHCLPAHRGVEVTDEVLDHENSWIYDQACNRMVVSKGVFSTLLTDSQAASPVASRRQLAAEA
ncbi:MAG: ornithine carbamoyltransferase [Balneolaceae bacterium]|nr:ornithine carbamoyltransferase [Balneolaceae bacterium]MDZ7773817.1 ornithine carbamoyltransferase [Balneolaceae bacterium]